MNETVIKILEEEKEYNYLSYYNMKKALDYKKDIYVMKKAICFLQLIL